MKFFIVGLVGAKIVHPVQKSSAGAKIVHLQIILSRPTSTDAEKIPLKENPKDIWRDRFTRPKRRVKDGFRLEYAAPDLTIKARFFPKTKNERVAAKKSAVNEWCEIRILFLREHQMKNNRQNQKITSEDFDSLFMWKVFRKLIRQETPAIFCLKVFSIAVFFVILILSIVLIGAFSGN